MSRQKVPIPVSANTSDWIAAEVLRDEFTHEQSLLDNLDASSQLDDIDGAAVELTARFLAKITHSLHQDPQSVDARTTLLLHVVKHFTSSYFSTSDVHTLTSVYDTERRKVVLSSYFQALAALEARGVTNLPKPPKSALITAAKSGKASIYALFGGQGINDVYFDELQNLYDIYRPYVTSLLRTLTEELVSLAEEHSQTNFYAYGLDPAAWLATPETRPPTNYLATVPISFPLIGLTQLVQYLIACKVLGVTPGELREHISGTTGHSQGIVSAVAIAASSSFEDFTQNASKALRWLFFSGLRGQEAFPVVSLEPTIVQDCIEGGEGTPTPMLSVTGLPLKVLETHIKTTNSFLPKNTQLHISLHNGPRAFVVTGPSRSLYGFVTILRKVRAPNGADQSKIPYSQRQPVFSIRFLSVGVPYHSEYLRGATERVLEDFKGQELWEPSDLAVPVYHTEDGEHHTAYYISKTAIKFKLKTGSDLRACTGSITRSLCDQIFTSPIHWTEAANLPETATHIVDFGPGGISGIGPLTARDLDGRGVRVIVLGDRAKGDVEFYNSVNVHYEDWWIKKWTPGLVRTRHVQILNLFER